jgi:hypothetical protein
MGVTPEEISNLSKSWEKQDKTYAEFIYSLFKDKYIEIYLGDSYEEISVEQISSSYPAVFCGKVVAAFKECLAIEAIHVTKQKIVKGGNIILINERAIRALSEVDSETGSLQDMILRSNEVNAVYKAYHNKTTLKRKP